MGWIQGVIGGIVGLALGWMIGDLIRAINRRWKPEGRRGRPRDGPGNDVLAPPPADASLRRQWALTVAAARAFQRRGDRGDAYLLPRALVLALAELVDPARLEGAEPSAEEIAAVPSDVFGRRTDA